MNVSAELLPSANVHNMQANTIFLHIIVTFQKLNIELQAALRVVLKGFRIPLRTGCNFYTQLTPKINSRAMSTIIKPSPAIKPEAREAPYLSTPSGFLRL